MPESHSVSLVENSRLHSFGLDSPPLALLRVHIISFSVRNVLDTVVCTCTYAHIEMTVLRGMASSL